MLSVPKKNNIYKFDEPHFRPIYGNMHLSNLDIDNKDIDHVKIDIVNLRDDVNNIKTEQTCIRSHMNLLVDMCTKINTSITEIHEKLTKYDLDEVSNKYKLLNDISHEYSYDIESQINNIDNINDADIDDSTNCDSETVELIKPKRKYTKKINK